MEALEIAQKMMTVFRDQAKAADERAEAAKREAATAEAKFKAAVEGYQQFDPNRTPQQRQPPAQQSSTMAASSVEDIHRIVQQTVADSFRSFMPMVASQFAQTKEDLSRQMQVTLAAQAEELSYRKKQGDRIRNTIEGIKAFAANPANKPHHGTTTYTAAATGGSHGFLGGMYGVGTGEASLGAGMADPRNTMAFAAAASGHTPHYGAPLGPTMPISRNQARKSMRREVDNEVMAFAAGAEGTTPFRTEQGSKRMRGSFCHPAEKDLDKKETSFFTGYVASAEEQALIDYLLPARST